jgi:hypothetical protein
MCVLQCSLIIDTFIVIKAEGAADPDYFEKEKVQAGCYKNEDYNFIGDLNITIVFF